MELYYGRRKETVSEISSPSTLETPKGESGNVTGVGASRWASPRPAVGTDAEAVSAAEAIVMAAVRPEDDGKEGGEWGRTLAASKAASDSNGTIICDASRSS